MKRHGFPRMTECKKGAGSVDDGIEFLQSFDIVVHPECPHTIEELANYSYKIDPKTDEVIPVLEDKNNHVIDALRYAVEGTRRSTYNLDALAS
jgi:phage terminase large subunit